VTGRTRGQVLRTALAGVVAAGLAGAAGGDERDAAAAGPAAAMDVEILQAMLELEHAQQSYYAAAARAAGLTGELRTAALVLEGQEARHVAVLERRLGRRARRPLTVDVSDVVRSPAAFRTRAIAMEEAVIAAYIGQGANLTRESVAVVTPIVSVEARHAAWLRDLDGVSPAPRAADPARPLTDVLAQLRREGLIR
jgi:rubrerythrin